MRSSVVLGGLLMTLVACGQKGPLMLPPTSTAAAKAPVPATLPVAPAASAAVLR